MEVFLYDQEDKLITNLEETFEDEDFINKIVIKQGNLTVVSRTGTIGYEVIRYLDSNKN